MKEVEGRRRVAFSDPRWGSRPKRLSPNHLFKLIHSVIVSEAKRWGRRALFTSSTVTISPVVRRLELVESMRLGSAVRALAQIMFLIRAEDQLVPNSRIGPSKAIGTTGLC